MDPKCGCMTVAYLEDSSKIKYTERFPCEKHKRDSEIALVQRRIHDLRERYKEETLRYNHERAAYLQRLEQLKSQQ